MKEGFEVLFNPYSGAVLGASGDPLKMGHNCVRSLKDGGFKGKVYPVKPNTKEVLGIKAYPTLRSTPETALCAQGGLSWHWP